MEPDESREAQIRTAKELFNQTWDLLDRSDRSADDELAMLGKALGSWALWRRVGDARNHTISDWQVSRVFAVLEEADWAMRYAESGLALCRDHELGPFLEAYAWESIARAAQLSGDAERRDEALGEARRAADRVEDGDDRQMVLDDLATIG